MSDGTATLRSLEDAAFEGLGIPKEIRDRAEKQEKEALDVGILGVGVHSTDEEIADWEDRLWCSQDSMVDELAKEWTLNILYDANYQYLTYHRGMKRWLPLQSLPWRVRSVYNVIHKALNWRVARLTENKPKATVQAGSTDLEDLDKAEFKEQLFWSLWETLKIHDRLRLARRWAGYAGSGYLKFGWDSMAGPSEPATKFFDETITIEVPPEDGDELAASLLGTVEEEMIAPLEFYVNDKGEKLGQRFEVVDDEDTGTTRRRLLDPPEGTATVHEGEAYCDLRTPLHIRFDGLVDDIADSWYVQDSTILPASRILALFPDAKKVLADATEVTGSERSVQTMGLTNRWAREVDGGSYQKASVHGAGDTSTAYLDREYLVRETWIYPQTEHIKKLWGEDGRVIVTIGGVVARHYPMPRWAREARNFVAITEDYEAGNHYRRPFLRDIIPLQDDINRSRSHMAEAGMVAARLVLGALQNHQVNLKLLSQMPGVLVTYKSPQHKPEVLRFDPNVQPMESFYHSSLAAAMDLANMNEASTGKLPSAGLAAKAIYALQYADERSITEASNSQDDALAAIAKALDRITRYEYTEGRKVRVVGENRYYIAEAVIQPEHLQAEVDYRFVPGSMLEVQKESVRNEVVQMMELGMLQPHEARKLLPSAVPGGLRRSYDQQEAKARRQVRKVLDGGQAMQPQPWDDPGVNTAAIEEIMLSARWDHLTEDVKGSLTQMWQGYSEMAQQAMAEQQGQQAPPPGGAPPGPPIGAEQEAEEFPMPEGAANLAETAEGEMGPPPEFTEGR